jgi:uncharacterized protein YndB with AHSA1/START domain
MTTLQSQEFGTIERRTHIEAAPEVVYRVVSDPRHVREWWPDEAAYEVVEGAGGTITFGDPAHGGSVVQLTVVEAIPPRTFSFRWTHPEGVVASAGNSFLVTFTLEPSGTGTLVTLVETGFREMGWEAAVLEANYQEHVEGWGHFLPRLVAYAAVVGSRA